MFTPQQIAEAIDDSDCAGVRDAVGALVFPTRPDLTGRLAKMPFGGGTAKSRRDVRARADAIVLYREMGVKDPRVRAAVICKLYFDDEDPPPQVSNSSSLILIPNNNKESVF